MPREPIVWMKKFNLLKAYLKGYPVWCTWQVTYRCNFRCSFCHYWKEKVEEEETSLEEFEAGARKLSQLGTLMISLAGGEPLLRPDLVKIVAMLSRYHFPMVTTNGWLMTRQLAKELFKAGLWGASVSLDYCHPESHDRQRGQEGAFHKAVQALRYLSEERTNRHQSINLMATLNHENLSHMEMLAQLAHSLGASFMVQPYSPLKTGDTSFMPQPGVSARLLQLKKKYKNFLSHPMFLGKFDLALTQGVPGCASGRAFFNIDNYGWLAKCVEFRDFPVGKLGDRPLDELVALLRQQNKENRCQGCWYNCRGEIEVLYSLGGLLARLPTLIFS